MKPEIQKLFSFLFLIVNTIHASLLNPLLSYSKLLASFLFFYPLRALIFLCKLKNNKNAKLDNFVYVFFILNLGKELIINSGHVFYCNASIKSHY